ncbi:hypothetical protein [Mesomycoplasma ovipneumoniae]|uniref:hypothetical protein n=1 Tax=Mesomycoplasma ovipneumoniae TaxID=29562 RepID=UPI0028A67377|nr:hypothetical protein [Mesomycoplasma ovipneumoniae]WNM14890.1 hypothetical protein RNM01_04050 [Mesomycoplasma ovipneumoniae]
MKNLELINLLSLGNVVVAQPYQNDDIQLKKFISKVESNILTATQDEEAKNSLIKEFGSSLDYLDSFSFKKFNYIFRARIFDNQDQKNHTFQELRKNSEIYKKFQELKSKNPRKRGKRSLFSDYQRLTIKNWIDRIQEFIADNKLKAGENVTLASAVGGTAVGAGVAFIVGASAVPVVGWMFALLAGAGLVLGAGATGTGMLLKNSSNYWVNSNEINRKLDHLKDLFSIASTSNDKGLEQNLLNRIKSVISEINQLSGNIIDFNRFDLEKIIASGY